MDKKGTSMLSRKTIIVIIIIVAIIVFSYLVYSYSVEHFYEPANVLVTDPMELTLYYAPWCQHCKALKPEWEKLKEFVQNSKELKAMLMIKEVNCDQNECPVQGYPTIILRKHNKEITYDGDRNIEGFVEFINRNK
jgi:thiol-disulfide isomerase/thioredoxin